MDGGNDLVVIVVDFFTMEFFPLFKREGGGSSLHGGCNEKEDVEVPLLAVLLLHPTS